MAKLLEKLKITLRTPEMRTKLIITAALLVVFRFLSAIPVPGVPRNVLESFFDSQAGGLFNFVDIFSGGTLRRFSIISVGLGAYINASVILQLLGTVVPKLEEMQKEGESGKRKLSQWTRMLTVPLASMQAFGIYSFLQSQGMVDKLPVIELAAVIAVLTAGAVLLMWLGEVLTEEGVGNGISMLIMAGIVSGLPASIGQGFLGGTTARIASTIVVVLLIVIIVMLVVLNEATRKIEVQYAKRVRGGKMLGGSSSYLPLKILQAGVMPIIFASSVMLLPLTVAHFLSESSIKSEVVKAFAIKLSENFGPTTALYAGINFVLVILFAYFYAFVVFKPDDVAENLKKQGGFIPGIRPGTQTAEYLTVVLSRLNFVGAIVLAIMAIMPYLLQVVSESLFPSFAQYASILSSGTSILIVVSVILEVKRSLDAMLVTRSYESFL